MLTLAVLLQLAGLVFTFTLGVAGYVIGPLVIVAGGWLYRRELRRRKELRDNPVTAAPPVALPRRPGWQRALIASGAVLVTLAGLFAVVWRLTAALADTADAFFLALKSGDMERARSHLSEDFRAATSDPELRRFVERSALAEYASASWPSRRVENTRGWLSGTVSTASGGSVPMEIALIREQGEWKILSLRKPEAGILGEDAQQPPSTAEQLRLSRDATAMFADAVAQRDFTGFHQGVSSLWRAQVTPAQLQQAFQSFIENDVNLSVLKQLEPNIRSGAFDEDGAFRVDGLYPTRPNAFSFSYRYIYEGVDWKLVGVDVKTL